MTKILNFLKLQWTEDVLHHEEMINKPHGISLSKVERSSDQVSEIRVHYYLEKRILPIVSQIQVIKPVNLEALSKWVGQIPEDVIQVKKLLAKMDLSKMK